MSTRVRVSITISEAENAVLKNIAFSKHMAPTTLVSRWTTARLWQFIDSDSELYEIWRLYQMEGSNRVGYDGR